MKVSSGLRSLEEGKGLGLQPIHKILMHIWDGKVIGMLTSRYTPLRFMSFPNLQEFPNID